MSVEDVTGLARELDGAIRAGQPLPDTFISDERVYAVPEAVAAALDAGRKYINSLDLGSGA